MNKNKKASIWHSIINKATYLVSIFGPLIYVHQVYYIWHNQNASGLSLFTWIGIFLGALLWFAYGLVHKDRPLIIMNFLLALFYGMIILGILKFSYNFL